MTQATNGMVDSRGMLRFLRKSSWCEITVIHQDKVGFKQETGWSLTVKGCFLPNIMQLVQGKILLVKSDWGKSEKEIHHLSSVQSPASSL